MEKLRNTHPTMTYMSDELILGRRLADGYELDHSELACQLRKMLGQPELPQDTSGSLKSHAQVLSVHRPCVLCTAYYTYECLLMGTAITEGCITDHVTLGYFSFVHRSRITRC